jgi:hypothetical protein
MRDETKKKNVLIIPNPTKDFIQIRKRQAVKKPHFYFFSTSQEVYKLILS